MALPFQILNSSPAKGYQNPVQIKIPPIPPGLNKQEKQLDMYPWNIT